MEAIGKKFLHVIDRVVELGSKQTQGYGLLTNKACVTKTEKLNEHPRNLLTSFCSATEGRLRETVPFRVTKFPLLKCPL